MKLTSKEKFIILVNNERIDVSDAIVLLEGDGISRVKRAAELFHQKFAGKIVFSGNITDLAYGSYPKDYIFPELIKSGVPEEAILHESKSRQTRDQAVEILAMAHQYEWKRLLLVASHYHQYRAFLTFLKVILEQKLDIEIINAPARELPWFVSEPWGKRIDLLDIEFEKIEKYRIQGHIATFEEAIEYQKWKETHL